MLIITEADHQIVLNKLQKFFRLILHVSSSFLCPINILKIGYNAVENSIVQLLKIGNQNTRASRNKRCF